MSETQTITLQEGTTLLQDALRAVGVPDETALSVATALVAAQAEGQVGHGFSRLGDYAAQVQSGKIVAGAQPKAITRGPSALHIDAGYGFAYPALDLAIARGTAMAQDTGVCAVTIAQSHHAGALSVQVDKVARAGLVGLMVANTPAAIAPWGGDRPIFGTNPIAFGAPRQNAAPLVIDLALSKVARGKIMNAKKTGGAIPEGWALDADGVPTTDPEAALQGSMVPIGEAKGTALALMVEVLAAALTGAQPGSQMSSFLNAGGPAPDAGQFLLILKPGDAGFGARLEALLSEIVNMDGTRLPGARRAAALAQAGTDGLSVPRQHLDLARRLASEGT